MNVLVIIKGQLRTWNLNKEHIQNFISSIKSNSYETSTDKKIFVDSQFDILFSYWDISYQLYPNYFDLCYVEKTKQEDFNDFEDFVKNKLSANLFYSELSTIQAISNLEKLNFELEEEYHLQCYLTYKTGLMKRKIELNTHKKYDYIIEIRPDTYYFYEEASYKIRFPKFGEILSLKGNLLTEIHGISSPATSDLIFFMSGKTYDIFTKEIFFHYETVKKNIDYSTAHFEKNIFFNANNLLINSLNNSFCSDATILRPIVDSEELKNHKAEADKNMYIKKFDIQWRNTKEEYLDIFLRKSTDKKNIFLNERKIKNKKLISGD